MDQTVKHNNNEIRNMHINIGTGVDVSKLHQLGWDA